MDDNTILTNTVYMGIIIPIYNVENYLEYCLKSICQQSYSHFVAICINDGSSDTSLNIAKKIVLEDNRFILINSNKNQGLSRARNIGIRFFQKKINISEDDGNVYCIDGDQRYELYSKLNFNELLDIYIDYLMFLDSDDYLERYSIETFLQYATRDHLDLTCAGIKRVDDNHKHIFSDYGIFENVQKNKILQGGDILTLVKKNYFCSVWNICIDFYFFNKLNLYFIDDILYEDHCFGIKLFIEARTVMIIPEFLYNQVESLNSITRPSHITYERLLRDYMSFKVSVDFLIKIIQEKQNYKEIIEKKIEKFYYPTLCEFFLKLTKEDRELRSKEIKELSRYASWRTRLMFFSPKLYRNLRKIKGIL